MRVLLVGLGPVGRRIAGDLVARGDARLVGAVDRDPALAGRRLADLVPGAPSEVVVAPSLDAAGCSKEPEVAVVATGSDLGRCAGTFRALLRLGLTVVSTCEELVHPWLRHPSVARELDGLARRHGGRLLGAGVNPGFLMDVLPVVLTAPCRVVRAVRVARVQDASSRRLPFQRKVGVGLAPEELSRALSSPGRGGYGHVGLGESLHLVAGALGLALEDWREEIAPVLAARDLDSGLGPVARGRVAGIEQTARGWAGGACVIELYFRAVLGEAAAEDRIRIEGEPPLDVVIAGGVHGDVATAAIVVNAIGPLRAARAGLHTLATIAPPRWRAAGSG